ncbi:MAG: hypothetical protein A4E28_00776 [Methanocella sp. PtaU1.Bin125]|nr:MAG: hypothetical protein A4E28_00776 [Methanocella sp. PtaU1.Bin125]
MINVGTNIDKAYGKGQGKGSPCRRKTGVVRSNIAILPVLAICMLITATIPANAMVVNDAEPSPATGQSASCPCKSQSSSQSATPAVQPQAVDASVLNQLVQSTYSPGDTAQPVAAYTPQYSTPQYSAPQYGTTTVPINTASLDTIAPVSIQNNAGTTQAAGVAPTADFSHLFSQWINNEIGGSVPGYSIKDPASQMFSITPMYTMNDQMAGNYPVYTANDRTVGINPVFSGWQMDPIDTVQAPMEAGWLNELMWF